MEIDSLIKAINDTWISRYQGNIVSDISSLIKRVKLIAEDRDCWFANAHANQKAYVKSVAKLQEIKT